MTNRHHNATIHFIFLISLCLTMAATVLPTPAGAEDASILVPSSVTPSADPSASSPASSLADSPSPEQEMQTLLQTLRTRALALKTDLAAGRSITDSQYQAFVAVIAQIQTAHQTLTERFDLRADTVQSLGGVAVDRQAVMLAAYQRIVPELLSLAASVTAKENLTPTLMDRILSLLSEVIAPPEPLILGALPVVSPGYAPGAPAVSPTVTPACQGGDKTVHEADTAAAPEAPITKKIAELAQSLNWNPVLMVEYVKNNIRTELYFGLMKGAGETLAQKSGNDADQAALLIALFRAAGYPARYVRGAIEFFPGLDQAKEHFGVQNPEKIAVLLQKAGIPFQKVISAGRLTNYRIDHVWAEVFIPYGPGRGADPRDAHKCWIPVDTSIKPEGYSVSEPAACDLAAAGVGQAYLDQYNANSFLNFLANEAEAWLDANGRPEAAFSDTLLTRTIKEERLGIISPALQFTEAAVTGEYTQLPDNLIHKVRFAAKADADLFDVTLNTFDLSNQPITLSFEPETVEDQEIINSFGGLDNTPCYLVRLRPVIRVNGVNRAVGADGLAMGRPFELTCGFISPAGTQTVTNTRVCGSLASIGLVSGDAVMPEAMAPEQKDAARLMHEMAIGYIDRWNKAEADLAGYLGMTTVRTTPCLVTVGGTTKIDYLLSDPHVFTWQGLYMDADLRAVGAVPAADAYPADNVNTFLDLTALAGSDLEARIFEETIDIDSISTAELFMLARQGNIPIVNIDKTNINTVLPGLFLAGNIQTDIKNAVNQGQTVRIPPTPVSVSDWTGIGYVKTDPATGESGWMLAGAIAGGMTVLNPDRSEWDQWKALKEPYSENTNNDPASAASIQKIHGTDLQRSLVGRELGSPLQVMVRDFYDAPVNDARVTFKVKKGGGQLLTPGAGAPVASVTVTTTNGFAEVRFKTGLSTSTNKDYLHVSGVSDTQVDLNIIEAWIEGKNIYIKSPFMAYGLPGPPAKITMWPEGTKQADILSFAGSVAATVLDENNNPVSNVPVVFTSSIKNGTCVAAGADNKDLKFVAPDESCLKSGFPEYAQCGSTDAYTRQTSAGGRAVANVILGGVPRADYIVTAAFANPAGETVSGTVTFHSTVAGSWACDDVPGPGGHTVVFDALDASGGLYCGRPGDTVDLRAHLQLVIEKEVKEDIECGGETCPHIYGIKQFTSDLNYNEDIPVSVIADVVFNNDPGKAVKTGNLYAYTHTITPGVNIIPVTYTATVTRPVTYTPCDTCRITEYVQTYTGTKTLTVYGISAGFADNQGEAVDEIFVLVNEDHLSVADTTLFAQIEPVGYTPANSFVVIYENNVPISYIPVSPTDGRDTAYISRGSGFDLTRTYTAGILINNGAGPPLEMETPADARLTLIPIMLELKNDDNEKVTQAAFGNAGKDKKRYHIEVDKEFAGRTDLTGLIRVVNADGKAVNPPSSEDFSLTEYPLSFEVVGDKGLARIDGKETFIISNLYKTLLESNAALNNAAKIYGGLGNQLEIVINDKVVKTIPIEPVNVIVIGIDGLRQDVLYEGEMDKVKEGDYHVKIEELNGLKQILAGYEDSGEPQRYIMLPNVTAIFPSITLASWASIFTGKMPGETGIPGNEFFARDLISNNQWNVSPAIKTITDKLPPGMVTLSEGAFPRSMGDSMGLVPKTGKWEDSPQNRLLNPEVKTLYEMLGDNAALNKYFEYNNGKESVVVFQHYARGADQWETRLGMLEGLFELAKSLFADSISSSMLDAIPGTNAVDWLENELADGGTQRNNKPFPAVFMVYFAGLDHYAHKEGMDGYTEFFKNTTDGDKIKTMVKWLTDADEFDNKIFIIVADHGMTAMPKSDEMSFIQYKKDKDGNVISEKTWHGYNSCELRVEGFDEDKHKYPELANNNLHIWELAEMMRMLSEKTPYNFKVLAPEKIAELYQAKSDTQEPQRGATSDIEEADFVAALNGPMAHIYAMGDSQDLGLLALALKRLLTEDGAGLNDDLRTRLKNRFQGLLSSVDKILIKSDDCYAIFTGLRSDGTPATDPLSFDDTYIKAMERVTGLRSPGGSDRSGDLVLIMKDKIIDNATNRFTAGVACKAWHGSLNSADSYVPMIVAYPGGNKAILAPMINDTPGCDAATGCDGNWRITGLIEEIIGQQYK